MLFVLSIILVEYSQEVSLLFQFGVFQFKCHFHSEKAIYLFVIIALQTGNIILYSVEFCLREKAFSKRENTLDLSIVTRLR